MAIQLTSRAERWLDVGKPPLSHLSHEEPPYLSNLDRGRVHPDIFPVSLAYVESIQPHVANASGRGIALRQGLRHPLHQKDEMNSTLRVDRTLMLDNLSIPEACRTASQKAWPVRGRR